MRSRKPEVEGLVDLDKTITESFPSWSTLKPIEQSEMKKNIKSFKGNVPLYENKDDCLRCVDKDCKFLNSDVSTIFPTTVATCPVCGVVDES